MTTINLHNLGYPRIGANRELKFACEGYWRGEIDGDGLRATARQLRAAHWREQLAAGVDWLPVGDFSYYDQVLDASVLLGNLPRRVSQQTQLSPLDRYFLAARGRAPTGEPVAAGEMTKWFDTNYHYIVPEFSEHTHFTLNPSKLLQEINEARQLTQQVKPVVIGPLTYLWLGKCFNTDGTPNHQRDKLGLLPALLDEYQYLLTLLERDGIEWLQIDEPILALDLPEPWQQAFSRSYEQLNAGNLKLLLASYFGPLRDNLPLALAAPTAGLHLDGVRGREDLPEALRQWPEHKILSLGVVDGRNVWKTDLATSLDSLKPIQAQLGQRLWLAPSCSLLHVPVDLAAEQKLDPEIRNWLAFARQKLDELALLRDCLQTPSNKSLALLETNSADCLARRQSKRVHHAPVAQQLASIDASWTRRSNPYPVREAEQARHYRLPALPTTTIGSFPQTPAIRKTRRDYKQGVLDAQDYREQIAGEIRHAIKQQEALGLDVLVHGEAERNDMVEYFGEQLAGYAFTDFGWVQSYGSRCVKPPIIYGDVWRPEPMTVEWTRFAQSLTNKPVKGMLTGPITMLQWSFVRNDQPRATTAQQIALALREEVKDLETAGINYIQVDEPALREGLPLRRNDWDSYLDWAVEVFRIATSGITDSTQIHTHMCYSEFNDIIDAIAALDADVITIETSRSNMELLDAFEDYAYPNSIGPGVYDIHSPNIPSTAQMRSLLEKAAQSIPWSRLWVNPDCGLKTRTWDEVLPALRNMQAAATQLRRELAQQPEMVDG